jgi:hypothetical protein
MACMGDRRGTYRILVGRHKRRRPLGRVRHRWEVNTKLDIQKIGWGDVHWIDVAQDREKWHAVVNAVMNFMLPKNARNFLTS